MLEAQLEEREPTPEDINYWQETAILIRNMQIQRGKIMIEMKKK